MRRGSGATLVLAGWTLIAALAGAACDREEVGDHRSGGRRVESVGSGRALFPYVATDTSTSMTSTSTTSSTTTPYTAATTTTMPSSSTTLGTSTATATSTSTTPVDKATFCKNACSTPGLTDAPPTNAALRKAWEQCKSCRCDEALGGLPDPSQFSCSADDAEEVKIYALDKGSVVRVKASPCLNPALLSNVDEAGACLSGSKFGQFTSDAGSLFKFICRKKKATTAAAAFDDWGLIGYNSETGATCFWDDANGATVDGKPADVRLFPLKDDKDGDLQARVDAYLKKSLPTDPRKCVGCHDNGPFMWTPYLGYAPSGEKNVWPIKATSETDNGPYKLVVPVSKLAEPDVRYLKTVSWATPTSKGKPCAGACHRLGSDATCRAWRRASSGAIRTGQQKAPPEHFHVQYWMPIGAGAGASLAEWSKGQADAFKAFGICCSNTALGTRTVEDPLLGKVSCTWGPMSDFND